MDLQYHSSVIFCNDLQEQRDFYEKFLEQEVDRDFEGCIVFKNGFSLWKIKKEYPISAELGYTYEPIGNRNFELCFETENFGESVEKVLLADLRILHNVVEEKWEIEKSEIRGFAENCDLSYILTSAKTGQNVKRSFELLTTEIISVIMS